MGFNSKVDEIEAEANSYTNYCKMLEYSTRKAEEYAKKAQNAIENKIELVISAFPYGVGPAIIAAKLQVKQVLAEAADVIEYIQSGEIIIDILNSLPIPEVGCPDPPYSVPDEPETPETPEV